MKTSVIHFLTHTLKRHSNKVAFVDEDSSLTFLELHLQSNVIANAISTMLQANTQKPIFVYLPKSTLCISTLIAVAKSGNFYTPGDIHFPLEKINAILNVLEPELVITDSKHIEKIKNADIHNAKILSLDSINLTQNIAYTMPKIPDTAPLYCLFTSGSTGVPKGVLIAHRSMIKFIQAMKKEYNITHSDNIANQAPFIFDVSAADMYNTIAAGACMYIVKKSLFAFPLKLVEFLNHHKITFIYWVPSALSAIANADILSRVPCESLNKICFGGEAMPNKTLNYWRKYCKQAVFGNIYGPTEVTVACAFYTANREFADSDSLPIGTPIENCEVLLLDDKHNAVKNGEIGEICVKGTCLALGYYGDFTKTESVFVQNPLNTFWQERIYKTGDLGYLNEFGELMYCGRKDSQIKHLGYRIELGEIESAMYGIEGIKNACVIYDEMARKIVAFMDSKNVGETELIKILANKLAHYMLPNAVFTLDRFPLNDNGKIDRKALKAMYMANNTAGGGGK